MRFAFFFARPRACKLYALRASTEQERQGSRCLVLFITLPTSCFSVRQVFFADRYTWITHQQVQRLVTYMDLAFVLILFMRQASSSDLSFWFFCRVETTSLSNHFSMLVCTIYVENDISGGRLFHSFPSCFLFEIRLSLSVAWLLFFVPGGSKGGKSLQQSVPAKGRANPEPQESSWGNYQPMSQRLHQHRWRHV